MELDKNNRESWIFAIEEGLEDFMYRNRLSSEPAIITQREEIEEALRWIREALIPQYSDEKIELMQSNSLIHRLHTLALCGSALPTPEERSQLADMILKRK